MAGRNHHFPHFAKTASDVIRIQMRENGHGDAEIERAAKAKELELVVDRQMRLAIRQPGGRQFAASRVDKGWVNVQPVIVSWIEVANEMDAAAKRAAADVDKRVALFQALSNQKIELQSTDFIPHAA